MTRDNNNEKRDNQSVIDLENKTETNNCIEFIDFIKSNSKSKDISIPLTIVKCGLNSELNLEKITSAEIIEISEFMNFKVLFYKLNCNAGADCAYYYLATINPEYKTINNKLVAIDASQGESNEILDSFNLVGNKLSLRILKEEFDDSIEDYIENIIKFYNF